MTPHTFSRFRTMSVVLCTVAALSALTAALSPNVPLLTAAVYSGGGIKEGITQGGTIAGSAGDPREVIIKIVKNILGYVALLATVAIIIAGLYLVLGMGSDSSKETAKKIIIYTAIGLIVILLAEAIVTFVTDAVTT